MAEVTIKGAGIIGLSIACDGFCLTLISFRSKLMEFYLSKKKK